MTDCTECMWWMSIDGYCLLGRAADNCANSPARRGDDELVERVLELGADQREELTRRMERAREAVRAIETGETPE